MIVKELIEQLQKVDQDKVIRMPDTYCQYGPYYRDINHCLPLVAGAQEWDDYVELFPVNPDRDEEEEDWDDDD